MASSSKSINMPLIFAITVGATVSLVAVTMFGLAWYQYESRVVLTDQVLTGPTHDEGYDKHLRQQEAHLGELDTAVASVVAEEVPAEDGHGGHGGGADH